MRSNPLARRVSAFLDVLPFPGLGAGMQEIPCLRCASPLALHQPDEESPDRLLGVCVGCRHWYLVDLLPGGTDGYVVGLPRGEVVRELSRADPSGGISLTGPEPDPGPVSEPGK